MQIKRFLALPLHHIDTSVILETEKTEDGRYCRKYLQLVGYKYRGILSFPVLSEMFSVIISLEDYNERQKLLEIVYELIRIRKIKFYSAKDIEEISLRIKEIDKRILGLDRK